MLEIERKFIVTSDSYKALAFRSDRIAQGYICREGGNSARVRVRGNKGYITIKGPSLDGGLSRFEWEKEITLDDARELFSLCGERIEKTRTFLHGRGAVMALFVALPYVGDAIAVVLGLMRSNVLITTLSMMIGKALRYIAVIYAAEGIASLL